MTGQSQWNEVYRTKPADSVSWFQADSRPSLDAIERLGLSADSAFIDVGGGASTLVDSLLHRGWTDVSVLDIAAPALDVSKARLAGAAESVHWLVADIVEWTPRRSYDVWHDRAVFHFLTTEFQRSRYIRALDASLPPGGHLIIATFAPDGPERCSGLPVQRYDAQGLSEAFGRRFTLRETWLETHLTPAGNAQAFTWCVFSR
jgi:trans-aconitate methyltransferase